MAQKHLIAALGDSLTAGHVGSMMGPTYSPYTDELQKRLGEDFSISNHGLDGDLTSGMVRRFRQHVLPKQPDTLLLMGGANDLGWGLDFSEILENLTTIIDESLAAGIQVFVAAITPIARIPSATQKRLSINPSIEDICKQKDITFVDVFYPLADQKQDLLEQYSSDGLHLNPAGYTRIGQLFHEALSTKS